MDTESTDLTSDTKIFHRRMASEDSDHSYGLALIARELDCIRLDLRALTKSRIIVPGEKM